MALFLVSVWRDDRTIAGRVRPHLMPARPSGPRIAATRTFPMAHDGSQKNSSRKSSTRRGTARRRASLRGSGAKAISRTSTTCSRSVRRAGAARKRPKPALAQTTRPNSAGLGRAGRAYGYLRLERLPRLVLAVLRELLSERGIAEREDRDREQRRVDRAGLADRERAHGNARRHLHGREQRVQAVERATSSAPRAPAASCARPPRPARCAAPPAAPIRSCAARLRSRSRTRRAPPARGGPRARGTRARPRTPAACRRVLHRLPVGLAAHQDGDERLCFGSHRARILARVSLCRHQCSDASR